MTINGYPVDGSKKDKSERRNWMPVTTFVIFFGLSLTSGYHLLNCDTWDENCSS